MSQTEDSETDRGRARKRGGRKIDGWRHKRELERYKEIYDEKKTRREGYIK